MDIIRDWLELSVTFFAGLGMILVFLIGMASILCWLAFPFWAAAKLWESYYFWTVTMVMVLAVVPAWIIISSLLLVVGVHVGAVNPEILGG